MPLSSMIESRLYRAARMIVFLTAVWVTGFVGSARADIFEPVSFTLDNGMRVVVVADHRAPVVTQMVCYGVGSADEPPRRSGIAHFLEHLMFKGTKEVSGKEFSRLIAINGGRDNAFTSYDYTAYYQTIASDRLELVMRLEADRMVNLTLAPEDVQVEREVILEERRQRVENEPQALLSEALNAALYAGHPYGRPITGWPDEIAALSRDDALAFYHRYYAPNNAVLVVAGDVEPEKVHALAQKYFGSIPSQEVPDRVRPSPVRLHADNRIEMADPRVSTASWRRAYQVPDAESFGLDRADALQVFMTALGQGADVVSLPSSGGRGQGCHIGGGLLSRKS